jgi:hypothetical protein
MDRKVAKVETRMSSFVTNDELLNMPTKSSKNRAQAD